MTVDEIFTALGKHMVEGLMVHTQMSDYFNFLSLKGYHKCHEYHFFEESRNFRKLSGYYLKHYNKLIIDSHPSNPGLIPEDWFKYKRSDVDGATRKAGIQTGFSKWVKWEQDTKTFYEQMHKELMNINEVAAAAELKKYIRDVDEELAKANQKLLELTASNFNISDIIMEQDILYEKYKKKMCEIFK